MKLLHSHIKSLSMKKKIHYIVMICIGLLSLVSLLSIQVISRSYQKVLYQSLAGSLSSSSQDLRSQLDNLSTMADLFLADAAIQDNLTALKETDDPIQRAPSSQRLYTTLNEFFFNFRKNQIRYMSLYQDQFSTHTYIAAIARQPEAITRDLIARAKEGRGKTLWISDYSQDYGLFMVREIRQIKYMRLDSLGVLVVNIDMNSLMNRLTASSRNYEGANYLLFDQGNIIYDSAHLAEDQGFDLGQSIPVGYGRLRLTDRDFFYVRNTVADLKWSYVCTIPYDTVVSALSLSRNLCLVMILMAIFISLLFSSRLIHSLTRHFDNLVIKMQNFGDGSFRPLVREVDYSTRKDELGLLHTQFDLMVNQVNNLIRSNYLNEILRKEAQLKALETQINPHFLYNTLESINWRAKALGAGDISSMAESLGTLLRITLDQKNKKFPLYRELELIHSYLTIQKFRYEERLLYDIHIPENLLGCEVLKLTLQPLVENALHYGLEENTEACMVQIIAKAGKDCFFLDVKNNGSSFADDLLVKLAAHEIQPHGLGIGLLNIHERLRLTYGSDYGLILYNEGDLAVARIKFPMNTP